MPSDEDVKRQLYDRQLYVWGSEAQRLLGQSDVLLVGMGGAGCCIAKNLLLAGVRTVGLLDGRPVVWEDLSTNFYATSEDVGRPRADVAAPRLAELNRFARVEIAAPAALTVRPNGQVDLATEVARRYHAVVFSDYPTSLLADTNDALRGIGVKFVACELRGVTGCVFVDGGDSFTVVDKNAEDCVSCVVLAISPEGTVLCNDDKKHECELGDKVYFTGIPLPEELNSPDAQRPRLFTVVDIPGPCSLKLDLSGITGLESAKSSGGYLHTTKQPLTMTFRSLRESTTSPEFLFIDDEDICAASMLHATYTAAHASMDVERGDVVNAVDVAAQVAAGGYNVEVVQRILCTFGGKLGPIACVVGAMAAQEAMKLLSGKFTPLRQWFYWDARQLLSLSTDPANTSYDFATRDLSPQPDRYAGLTKVMGRRWVEDTQRRSAFIVGAGALGCELIKNVALLGLGTSPTSDVVVTDMDTIELSNLSRQFLFRQHHIGCFKSTTAAEAARGINPSLRVRALQQKIAPETEGTFDVAFWESRDVVINALDNVASRKYVDAQCLTYGKPLFESGTLGAKCNTQTVVPHLTESYGVSYDGTYDPPEQTFALCTIKNFPYAIEHTIHWAREMFAEWFVVPSRDLQAYASDANFASTLSADPANRDSVVHGVVELLRHRPGTAHDCVAWARRQFTHIFDNGIRQLLFNVPLDKKDERGNLFWSGTKKPPTPLSFDANDEHHVSFVRHAAVLFGDVFGMAEAVESLGDAAVLDACARTTVEPFEPTTMKFALSEKDASQGPMHSTSRATLPPREEVLRVDVFPLEFEKDNDRNHHIDFITAASNLRALNYGIPPVDRHRTKMIAGKIVPAMVTTTSLATGLVCVELCKYLLGCQRRSSYRNAFVNVAAPLMAFNEPHPTPSRNYTRKDSAGRDVVVTWTIWDRLDVNEGRDVTLQELVQLVESRFGLDIMMMSLSSGKMVYNAFARKRERMAKRVREVVEELSPNIEGDYYSLIIAANFGDDEAEVPLLRYKFRNF